MTLVPKLDSTRTMKAIQWHGAKDMRVADVPVPLLTDPGDAIVRVTSTAICGSDLHHYVGLMPGMKKGDVVGHEFMGRVEAVGPGVRSVAPGDRVVAAFDIACGRCYPCAHGAFSGCATTNASAEQEALYGNKTAALFGYSHLTGGVPGGQVGESSRQQPERAAFILTLINKSKF